MIRVQIISPGKIKDAWLDMALQEYVKRLSGAAEVHCHWCKDEKAFQKLIADSQDIIYLDPHGKDLSSEAFSEFFFKEVELRGSKITFAIGGPDGLKNISGPKKISLSKMTFTHQMARLILIEQVYRAFQIRKGSDYHK
jgi:23S rRNA (pseudouridine1915-N3)-methyltransferase